MREERGNMKEKRGKKENQERGKRKESRIHKCKGVADDCNA